MVGALDRAGAAALQLGRGARVRAEPAAARDRVVDRVAHDGVAEREPARRLGGADERAEQQLVERVQRAGLAQPGDRGGEPELERVAGHRRRVEQRAARRARRSASSAATRGRHRARHLVALQARELLEVERVAARLRVQRAGRPARPPGPLSGASFSEGTARARAGTRFSRAASASRTGAAGGRRTSAASAPTDAGSAQWRSSRQSTSGRVAASRSSRSRSAR